MDELGVIEAQEFADTLKTIVGTTGQKRRVKVQQVDSDGTVWIQVPGSDKLTPITSSAVGVTVGDTVYAEFRGDSLYIEGNASDPPRGFVFVQHAIETIVAPVKLLSERVKLVADEAKAIAEATGQHFWDDDGGAHVTDVTREEWEEAEADDFSDLSDAKPYHNLLMNSLGILLRRALFNLVSISRSAIAFYDGTGNTASHIVATFGIGGAQIGKTGAAHSVIDDYGQRFYGGTDGSVQLANIGYGEGATQSGTEYAPYYTFGVRIPNYAIGAYSVAEGSGVIANGYVSHAEGSLTEARGNEAHAEGFYTLASNDMSHAEGAHTTASGQAAHAEGYGTTASRADSHAEGSITTASGNASHSEGYRTTASGDASHAGGCYTIAASDFQTAIGKYNVGDANDTYALIIGNGTADNARSNALTVGWDGLIDQAGRTAYPLFVYSTAPAEADLPVTPCFVLATDDYGLWFYDGN